MPNERARAGIEFILLFFALFFSVYYTATTPIQLAKEAVSEQLTLLEIQQKGKEDSAV